jgi:predicted phosphoribosyltransferase
MSPGNVPYTEPTHHLGRSLQPGRFADRRDAGNQLAAWLTHYRGRGDVTVLALPRGGVPVAAEIAGALGTPLDVFVVRKLGMPGHPEFAIGAIASGGVRVLSRDVIREFGIPTSVVDAIAARELAELDRREREYREERPPADLRDRIVILVDDGLATGSTMRAAVEAVRRRAPARVVIAVPVGAPETCDALAAIADELICARRPGSFSAVGLWYHDFSQTSDAEVRELLARHAQPRGNHSHPSEP